MLLYSDDFVRIAALPLSIALVVSCEQKEAPHETATLERVIQRVFHVDDFPGKDDREKINNAMAAMQTIEGDKTLRFTRREYLVRPVAKDNFEPIIGGTNLRQLTIDGQGAVLVAQDCVDCQKGYFFRVHNFKNLAIRDLTLTYRPHTFVQGRIFSTDQANNRTTVALDPSYGRIDTLVQTPMSKLWCRVGQTENALWPQPGNPSWMEVGVDDMGKIIADPVGQGLVTMKVGFFDRTLTLNGEFNWQPGDPIVIWKRGAQDGFYFEDGSGLSLGGIRVEAALHYAIKLRGVIGATVENCHVTPAPGAMISSSADGIDVQQSRYVTIEKCNLVATGDDAISFLNHGHGDNGQFYEKRFGAPYPDTNEYVTIRRNWIEGGNRNGILLLASKAEITENTIRHTRQYGIKFSGDFTRITSNLLSELGSFAAFRHISDELNTGIIGSDEWHQHSAVISGNVIEDWHHMPAILIKSLSNSRVTGNTFIMRDSGRIQEKPINSYLLSLPAVCVTSGHFNGNATESSEIVINKNHIQSGAGWSESSDAIFIHGTHDSLESRNNTIKHNVPYTNNN